MPSSNIKTFSSHPNAKSVLDDPKIQLKQLNLNNKEAAGRFAHNAEQLHKKFEKDANTTQSEVYVDFDKTVFGTPDYKKELERTFRTKSLVDQTDPGKKSKEWRHLTKHRIVTSLVKGSLTASGANINPPYNVLITTACAPNAAKIYGSNPPSPSSPKDQSFFFKNDSGLLKYKAMMKLTYERCLYAQLRGKTQVLIIPPLGLGVYLNTLDQNKQTAVKKANYQALREAIESIQDPKNNRLYNTADLKEMIFLSFSNITQNIFSGYKGSIPVTLASTDALETAQKLNQDGKYQVGMINAGSDRTIGGNYIEFKDNTFPPMEEMLSQATDLVYRQASNLKHPKSKYIYHAFPKQLHCDSTINQKISQSNLVQSQNQSDNTTLHKASQNTLMPINSQIASPDQKSPKFVQNPPQKLSNNIEKQIKTDINSNDDVEKLNMQSQIANNISAQSKSANKSSVPLSQPQDSSSEKPACKIEFKSGSGEETSTTSPNKPIETDVSYAKFKETHLALLNKQRSCFLGWLFRRTHMDFEKYTNIDEIKKYIKAHPKSRSATVYNQLVTNKSGSTRPQSNPVSTKKISSK